MHREELQVGFQGQGRCSSLLIPGVFRPWALGDGGRWAGMEEKGFHKGDSVKTEEPLDGFEWSLSRGLVTTTPGPSVFLVSRLLIWFTWGRESRLGKSPWLTVYSATGSLTYSQLPHGHYRWGGHGWEHTDCEKVRRSVTAGFAGAFLLRVGTESSLCIRDDGDSSHLMKPSWGNIPFLLCDSLIVREVGGGRNLRVPLGQSLISSYEETGLTNSGFCGKGKIRDKLVLLVSNSIRHTTQSGFHPPTRLAVFQLPFHYCIHYGDLNNHLT